MNQPEVIESRRQLAFKLALNNDEKEEDDISTSVIEKFTSYVVTCPFPSLNDTDHSKNAHFSDADVAKAHLICIFAKLPCMGS